MGVCPSQLTVMDFLRGLLSVAETSELRPRSLNVQPNITDINFVI
jgi:hypothetical protein